MVYSSYRDRYEKRFFAAGDLEFISTNKVTRIINWWFHHEIHNINKKIKKLFLNWVLVF